MYYFYILQSQKDNSYYYGSTSNLKERLERHDNSGSRYTSCKKPWRLVHSEKYRTLSEARKREFQVKLKKRKSYVDWLVKNRREGP